MDIKEEIIGLTTRLLQAREAYYKNNAPIMSDEEYDARERKLTELVRLNPSLKYLATVLFSVGNDLTSSGRFSHKRPMRSIENKYEESDLIDWYSALPFGTYVCEEPKFDGISCSLTFEKGKLVLALTRGDGASGEDITAQIYVVRSIPKVLPPSLPAELEVRGELVMRNSTLERINREAAERGGKIYSSTRNLTGGTMKNKDLSLIPDREILIMPWDVLGDLEDSGLARLGTIAVAGFPLPMGELANNGVAVGALLHKKLKDRETVLRNQMSLETDGVVIKVDSHELRQKLGIGSKFTNYQVCYKPQSAKGTTTLKDVIWQVGRTGKVTPVGFLDPPLNLAGAMITNVNLNNISWIRGMGLKKGSRVRVCRSGDVIPLITEVLNDEE